MTPTRPTSTSPIRPDCFVRSACPSTWPWCNSSTPSCSRHRVERARWSHYSPRPARRSTRFGPRRGSPASMRWAPRRRRPPELYLSDGGTGAANLCSHLRGERRRGQCADGLGRRDQARRRVRPVSPCLTSIPRHRVDDVPKGFAGEEAAEVVVEQSKLTFAEPR